MRWKRGDDWLFSDSLAEDKKTKPPSTTRSKASKKSNQQDEVVFDMSQYDFDFSNQEMPSWEYYEAAAEEEIPTYRVELAKSGRSRCKATGKAKKCYERGIEKDSTCTDLVDSTAAPEIIEQGEIRVGWVNAQTGTYGGWKHLRCWRVPSKVGHQQNTLEIY